MSPNRRFDPSNYLPLWRPGAAALDAALAADTFRFDASDLMPAEIGADRFWKAMITYAKEGPGSLDRILAELDAAWPDGS
jgi:alpha-glucoside transport system substrate-binding protein